MQPNPGPGKLIVLEGLDGAGTTTQAALLADWLRQRGRRVHVTQEPTAGPVGGQIRLVLTHRLRVDGRTLAALFAADRLDHLYGQGGILERLQAGVWVILDRYFHSSFAYQALALPEAERPWLWELHSPCLIPDITLFLDVPVDECLNRITRNRGDHFELFEKQEVLSRVRAQYLEAIGAFRQRGHHIQMITGVGTIDEVSNRIREAVQKTWQVV